MRCVPKCVPRRPDLLPMARIALAGNVDHTLLAECPGVLLAFFDTPEACVLRLVCREFQAAVAAHPWEDRGDGDPGQHWQLARVLSPGQVRQCA